MHDPQNPNFYFANQELGPLLDDFDGPIWPQGSIKSKSCTIVRVFDDNSVMEFSPVHFDIW